GGQRSLHQGRPGHERHGRHPPGCLYSGVLVSDRPPAREHRPGGLSNDTADLSPSSQGHLLRVRSRALGVGLHRTGPSGTAEEEDRGGEGMEQ
ncbi:Adck1, partial [Symbiodinium sp. CCMP2456]